MREAFAHDAVVEIESDDDLDGPGAAITVSLCGHWEHEPPCPLAAHHTGAERDGAVVRLRVLFATEARDEAEVRRRIDRALAEGEQTTPSGGTAHWRLVSTAPGTVEAAEAEHARRLAQ